MASNGIVSLLIKQESGWANNMKNYTIELFISGELSGQVSIKANSLDSTLDFVEAYFLSR